MTQYTRLMFQKQLVARHIHPKHTRRHHLVDPDRRARIHQLERLGGARRGAGVLGIICKDCENFGVTEVNGLVAAASDEGHNLVGARAI